MAFPILCFGVLTLFLGCLGLFALAVTKVVAPDGRGHARGFIGGVAAMLALLLLCFLGVTGLGATVAAIGLCSVSQWNPIKRIEIHRDDRPRHDLLPSTEKGAVSARFTVRGEGGGELGEMLQDLFDVDPGELDDGLTVQRRTAADGTPFSVYEFRLPVSEADLARFEREVNGEVDGLNLRLPESVDIQFEGVDSLDTARGPDEPDRPR